MYFGTNLFLRLIVHLIAGSDCLLVLTVKSKNCTKLKCDQKLYPDLQTAYTLHLCRGGHVRYLLDQAGPAADPGFSVGRRRPVGGGAELRCRHFSAETCKNERIGFRRGLGAPATPTGLATEDCLMWTLFKLA